MLWRRSCTCSECDDRCVDPPELIAPRAVEELPRSPGWSFEPKWDGYRSRLTVGGRVELRSRRDTQLADLFPDIARAATDQVPSGTMLDGELVAFVEGRLSFDVLQQRMAGGPRRAEHLARVRPASLVIFDVLCHKGQDVTGLSWLERRVIIDELGRDWQPPLQLTPYTADRDEAIDWMQALAPMGIEGIVAKRTKSRYRRGADWIKVRYRETLIGLIGAVIGPITAPEALIIGQADDTDRLTILGRTSPLSPSQTTMIGRLLRPPAGDHPWPDVIGSGQFGSAIKITKVEPELIAEITADTVHMGGRRRHALRFIRLRLD